MKESKDPWKSMIDENREAFDQREPKDLWTAIKKDLDVEKKQPKTIELMKVYRIAAILIVFVGVAFFVLFQNTSQQAAVAIIPEEEAIQYEVFSPELLEVESFYTSEIEDKLKEVKSLTDDNIAVKEIKELKEEFEKLKNEMGDHVNDERVMNAMIQNYRLRLDLLKEILSDLKAEEGTSKTRNYEI